MIEGAAPRAATASGDDERDGESLRAQRLALGDDRSECDLDGAAELGELGEAQGAGGARLGVGASVLGDDPDLAVRERGERCVGQVVVLPEGARFEGFGHDVCSARASASARRARRIQVATVPTGIFICAEISA